ncbi:hypothetical protein D3C75_637020 [compost metagenome]
MSRTIRRKGLKYPTGWYSRTREEFDDQKEYYLSGDWRGTRSYTTTQWLTGKVITHTYQAKWIHNCIAEHHTYDDYLIHREAIHHSDAGHPVDKYQVNAWFRRMLNRSFRAKQKHQLTAALVRGEEEDLLLDPFKKDASWWY